MMNNNPKKPKISYSLISFGVLLLIALVVGSYLFYSKSTPEDKQTKVRSNDYLSIDSIKTLAVRDTVDYLNKIATKMQNDLSKKDSINRLQTAMSLLDKKKIDSLESKLYISQRKYRVVKDSLVKK